MIYPSTALYPSSNTYPERVVPNFVFDDDAVLIPYKTITSTDSATVTESVNPFVFEPRSDSLVFADNIDLSTTTNLVDSASVSEEISLALEITDSLALSEFVNNIEIIGPHEHLYINDFVNISLENADTATLEDTNEIGVSIEDTLTVSDAVEVISFAQSDELTATDALIAISALVDTFDLDQTFIEFEGFVVADPPGFDHMHWNDEFDYQFIATTLSTLDDPVLSEDIPNIEIPVVDSANVSEFIELSLVASDDLSVSDILLSLTIEATSEDQFIYQEVLELTTDTNVFDDITITDTGLLTVDAVGNENIALGESVSITVSVLDTANLTETIQNELSVSDVLNFVENKSITLTQSDSSIFNELAQISAQIVNNDNASLTESDNQIALAVMQLSHLLETPFYHADYSRLDYLFLISEIANATILKEADDSAVVTDLVPNILLNGYQLMTFAERVGIGKAAPLVLNINENPTVHGSATGDIIIISTGGTEPVLL